MDGAKALETPPARIVFDVTHHPTRIHVIEALRGKSGYLTLTRLVVDSYEREEYLLFSGFDDMGSSLDQETMEKLFGCAGRMDGGDSLPAAVTQRLAAEAERHAKATVSRSLEQNSVHFNQAREKLEKWADDMVLSAEKALQDTKEQIKSLRRQARQATTLEEQHQIQEKIQKLEHQLRYMLDVETRGSQSLLNVLAFSDPPAYKLNVKRPGSDESREVSVDLLETFNYLIGLTVQHIAAPQAFAAEFERDSEKRLRLKGRLKQDAAGPWWFRTVTGSTPDGRRTLVIWRKLTGDPEQDNLVLDEWFTKQGYSTKDYEFQLIYVNGDNNLENLNALDDTWKVRLIEEDFHRLMFDMEGV